MASSPASPPRPRQIPIDRVAKIHGKRPHPIRTQSEANADDDEVDFAQPLAHTRHKSTATTNKLARLSATPTSSPRWSSSLTASPGGDSPSCPRQSVESHRNRRDSGSPSPCAVTGTDSHKKTTQDCLHFDFGKIDYELDRARRLGSGMWSDVYLCEPTLIKFNTPEVGKATPPEAARRCTTISPAAVFAVKVPARRDAVPVLRHEALILTYMRSFAGVSQYTVPFFGLDPRNSALVFEAVVGGSLDDLTNRLKHMTEVSRHQEVVNIFPGLSTDLISGLAFLHEADIVHADIKPMNILLDMSDHYSLPAPVIRARYIDFSAAFIACDGAGSTTAGGTWEYMAPEQIRVRAQPTLASDVWSLGISLLTIILLTSPYKAACGDNTFMLREAIKSGDPLGFARMDPTGKDRMSACQEYIDWCKLALQKDLDKRVTAGTWRNWLETHVE